MNLEATASPEAIALLNQGLLALQRALKEALAAKSETAALQQALDEAFSAYDAYLAYVVGQHPMSCRLSCTACCHDNPQGVTGIEALRLQNQLKRLPLAQQAAIRAQATAALQAGSQNPHTWRARKVPCPLLHDNQCTQYSVRPIACRAFYAHSPAEWCDPGHPRYASRVNPHLDPPRVYLQILSAISDVLGLGPARDLHTVLAAP